MLQVAGTKDHYHSDVCSNCKLTVVLSSIIEVLVRQASPVYGVPGCGNVFVHVCTYLCAYIRMYVCVSVLVFMCCVHCHCDVLHITTSQGTGTGVVDRTVPTATVWLCFTDPYSPSPTSLTPHSPLLLLPLLTCTHTWDKGLSSGY